MIQNPFLLSGYVSPEFFCDRKIETEKLISALHNGRNITLVSPRRMGKTGLIRHSFHFMEQESKEQCYLVDLYQTECLADMVAKMARAVIGTLDTKGKRMIKTLGSFFKSLRPVLSFDPYTGMPSVNIDIQPDSEEQSLAEIFAYMEQSGKRCYVAFDEFQKVADYDERNVEALLRSHIQHLTNVHFIFSGSQRHVLENMFTSSTRPFYQSTQLMTIDGIDEDAYYQFASTKLAHHGQQIDRETFAFAYNRLFGHTWYMQVLLNRLYEKRTNKIEIKDIDLIFREIVAENEASFQTLLRMLTPVQRKLLRAVAREGEAAEVTGKSFLSKHKLGAASTVNSAVKSLVDKEIVIDQNGKYSVYDRFLALYLTTD